MYNVYVKLESLGDCIKKQEKYTALQVEVNKMHEQLKKKKREREKVRLESISWGFTKSREGRY